MVAVEGKQFKCGGGGGGKKNNRNVVAVVEGKQLKCGGGGGGGGKTIEMWRWWYIASLFTKQC